ncbi:hypothetical protein RJT34_14901 [Clitoria ternatea]|uniref:Uncharacterized protein n=1 Tax=Clitoria ternatea TaxID=43366 RepID=A0AAN9JR80_CLITE
MGPVVFMNPDQASFCTKDHCNQMAISIIYNSVSLLKDILETNEEIPSWKEPGLADPVVWEKPENTHGRVVVAYLKPEAFSSSISESECHKKISSTFLLKINMEIQ